MRNVKMMAVLLPLMAGGCVRSAMNLAALPARSADKVVDWSTTSREEAYRHDRRAEDRRAQREAYEMRDQRAYVAPAPSYWQERPW